VPTEEPDSLTAAKSYAFRLLSRRPYSRVELTRRLERKGFSEGVSQETVKLIERYGYVNDNELAKREVEQCLQVKKLGPKRIRLRLHTRGIAPETIEEVLSSIDADSVYRLCLEEARTKLATMSEPDAYKKQSRLGSFLLRRGFGFECVTKCLRELTEA
jgi:regulatory protein